MTICSNTFMVINIFNSAALCCSLSVILGRKSLTEAPSVNIVLGYVRFLDYSSLQ